MDPAAKRARTARRRMYKPAITRLPSLLCLLLVTLTLIALIELACHRLQNADKKPISHTRRRDTRNVRKEFPVMHVKRNDTALSTTPGPPSTSASTSQSGSVTPTVGGGSSSTTTAIPGTGYLPVGGPSSTTTAIPGPVYLPIGGPSSTTTAIPGTVFLPVGGQSSIPGTVYLSVGGPSSTTTAIPGTVYLPVGGQSSIPGTVYLSVGGPSSTTTAIPGSVFLPVGGSESTPTGVEPSSVFLPVSGSETFPTGVEPSSVFLPVNKNGPTSKPPEPTYPIYLPLGGGPISTTAALGPPEYLPIGGDSSPSEPTPGNFVPIPVGDTSGPNGQGAGFENIPNPQDSGISTGVAAGVPYSFGVGGSVVIEGSTFMTSTPTTAVLSDGRVAVIGPGGTVAIENLQAGSSGLTTGVAAGVSYTIGPQGSVFVGGVTLQTSSPTTTTLPDGQVVVVGPTGAVAIQGLSQSDSWSPTIGVADGVVYGIEPGGMVIVEGQTFQSSSPTTATLSDGHVLVVGQTGGIAIEDSKYTPTPTVGTIDGMPYTLGADGAVIIDGHTFDPSSPMTTTLSDGYVILIGPTGAKAVAAPASTDPPTPITGMADGVPYSIGTDGMVVIEGHTFKTSLPTTTTFSDGHILVVGPTGAVSLQDQALPASQSESLSIRDYLIGAFVPTLIAVLFSIPWHILSSAIKEMEPLFQLQRVDGAPAETSICLGYKASITPISTLNAIRNGHFLVWASGLLSLVVLLIPPLSSETVFIGFTDTAQCTITSTARRNCFPVLSVYPLAARIVEGILAFVAVTTLAILITMSRRKTGVFANPMSIAGLATLFQDRRVIEDFRRINAYWPDIKQLKNALRGHRYRIGAYTDIDGSPSYGLMSVHTNAQPTETAHQEVVSMGNKKYTSVAVSEVEEPLPMPTKRQSTISTISTHSATLVFFASMIAGLLGLVVYYYKNGSENPFEAFMDNLSFGTHFLFTALGVLIKVYMSYIDNDLRLNYPYRLMSTGPTPPHLSILPTPPSNPFTGLFHSLARSNYLSAYFSLTTLLCEPLIVALATVPFKPTSTFLEYLISTWLTVAILSMTLIGLVSLLYARWAWRKRARVYAIVEGKGGGTFKEGEVREPETLAEGLWLLCGSRMVGDFRGMGSMPKSERDEIVRKWGRVYEIGAVVGVDGVERMGVEESTLEGND